MLQLVSTWWRSLKNSTDKKTAFSMESVVSFGTHTESLQSGITIEVNRLKQQVNQKVQTMKSLTEQEVLSCGSVLLNIVDNVQELISETNHLVENSVQRSDSATSHFIAEMQKDIQTQEQSVSNVLSLADNIQTTTSLISRLTEHSKLIAVNSKIEAARLGEQGKGFMIIAEQIRELGDTIKNTVVTVNSTIGAIQQSLPAIIDSTRAMQERTRFFTEMVEENIKSALEQKSAGSTSNEHLISLCNEALSHLQFQDTLSQKLSSLCKDMDMVEKRMGQLLAGEPLLDNPEDEELATEQVASGDFILF